MSEERMRVLEMIDQGVITPAEGAQLLAALSADDDRDAGVEAGMIGAAPRSGSAPPPPAGMGGVPPEGSPRERPSLPPELRRWRDWWVYPFGAGVIIATASGLLLYQGLQNAWAWFWMVCIGLSLLFGIAVITLSWLSRTARWLHLRVHTGQGEWPRRISISLPLPIRAAAWALRRFGRHIPGMEGTALDEVIMALGESATPDAPLYVEVDEGTGGERVQVYIG